jgi:hypothetical protein
MKRWIALSIPLLVVVFFLVAVAAIEAQRTPEWQGALSGYISNVHATQPEKFQVDQVTTAKLPWNFRADWDFPVLDAGRFGYEIGQHGISGEIPYSGQLALPYPPQTVHCVLLREGEDERVIFVNYYNDGLWQYGWVIQEGARYPFTAEFSQRLAEIGCKL